MDSRFTEGAGPNGSRPEQGYPTPLTAEETAGIIEQLWCDMDERVDYGVCQRRITYSFTVHVYGHRGHVANNRKWFEEQLNALMGGSASQALKVRVTREEVRRDR